MEVRGGHWKREVSYYLHAVCLSVGIIGLIATQACATTYREAKPTMAQPGIEILALSRGRGVPEATLKTLQLIAATAEAAINSGSVISVTRETIGLEGETRLCILFRDEAALSSLTGEIRKLAQDVDLLQIKETNCPKQ